VTRGFVDRERELDLFRRMLAGETNERILRILERAEQGKTFFLLQLVRECDDRDVPTVLLDFDQRRAGLTDYLSVAQTVRRQLGDERTPAICDFEDGVTRRRPGVSGREHLIALRETLATRFSEGELRTLCFDLDVGYDGLPGDGTKDKARELVAHAERHARLPELATVGARLRPDISWPATLEASAEAPSALAGLPLERLQIEMGRALCRDLANLGRAALLIDTFEHASQDTCAWLERWLFEPIRRELPHVLLVVAGRPECRPFFHPPRLWTDLVVAIDRFDPLNDDHIQDHYHQRGISVSSVEVSFWAIARSSPAKMALLGDLLQQTYGGAR